MSQATATDGLLQEWGTRLFYGMPKRAKSSDKRINPLGGMARGSMDAASVRASVRATIGQDAKQVVVKITGGGRGMLAVAAHFRYISRLDKEEVGGKGQSLELEDENGARLSGKEDLVDLQDNWRMSGTWIPDESHRKEAFNIILSMPEGTSADAVRDAARVFARQTFAGHKYVFALHDDTDSPHVHLAVRAEGVTGRRLNPRKADLQEWRDRFAATLQDIGVNAVSTRRIVRGRTELPRDLWEVRAEQLGMLKRPATHVLRDAPQPKSYIEAAEAWGHLASALVRSEDEEDKRLAAEVIRFAQERFSGVWQLPDISLGGHQGGRVEREFPLYPSVPKPLVGEAKTLHLDLPLSGTTGNSELTAGVAAFRERMKQRQQAQPERGRVDRAKDERDFERLKNIIQAQPTQGKEPGKGPVVERAPPAQRKSKDWPTR